jgi:hypothetical protein
MFAGVSLAVSELPEELVERHGLHRRVYDRGGEREVQFLLGDVEPVLPAWLDGRLSVLRWGNRGQSRALPRTAWTWLATLEEGGWAHEVVPVVIPATLGLDRGVWYRIRQGVRGVVVQDERGSLVVYPVVEPASHYYAVMTRSVWMPVLVGERI